MSLCMSVDTNVQLARVARVTRAGRLSIPETSFRSIGNNGWDILWGSTVFGAKGLCGRSIDTELWMKPPWFKGIFNIAVWDEIGHPDKVVPKC